MYGLVHCDVKDLWIDAGWFVLLQFLDWSLLLPEETLGFGGQQFLHMQSYTFLASNIFRLNGNIDPKKYEETDHHRLDKSGS